VYVTWSGVRDMVGHLHASSISPFFSPGNRDSYVSSSAPRSTNLIEHIA
jgi:hypothetical protein